MSNKKIPIPTWLPDAEFIKTTNIYKLMQELGFGDYQSFYNFSVSNYPEFWKAIIEKLQIAFTTPYQSIVDLSDGVETPHWLKDAKLNIINSCFKANEKEVAIIEYIKETKIKKTTYGELNKLSNRIANSISQYLDRGERAAIIMPMTTNAIAIFIGLIKAGITVVTIPDSFSANEISNRLRITNVKAVFTQDYTIRNSKWLHLYEKIIDANAPFTISLPIHKKHKIQHLRKQDLSWVNFLSDNDVFEVVDASPDSHTTILFSSGTMGEPKAIPWSHTTPIKCASDAYLYHNVKPKDVICWPTNLGWMMGPWLVYAVFMNEGTLALYNDSLNDRNFGKFIETVKVNILGVIPTLVKQWRKSGCMEGLDWSAIKLISSTGECSNPNDMLYLMSLAKKVPIIEYCGGTEIGGAYVTSTVIHPCTPSTFTTKALGLDFEIIDESGLPTENGEVALLPPSIGLSTELLNKNHHQLYYAHMPTLATGKRLRRHGDHIEVLANGFYRMHGRMDDTMNLSGIKVSSGEIEAILNQYPELLETAAIAVDPTDGGPSQLVIYVVVNEASSLNLEKIKDDLQKLINKTLNPLFKIHDLVCVEFLPRTASHKIMRKILREEYQTKHARHHKKIAEEQSQTAKIKVCLALQGGGAYGAYTWGILDRFLEDDRIEIESISATSAGSVNAVVLADGLTKGGVAGARRALNHFWETLSQYGTFFSPIRQMLPYGNFPLHQDAIAQLSFTYFDFLTRIFSPYILNIFNFDLLRYLLEQQVDFDALRKMSKVKLFLCATNVKTGLLHIFEDDEITVEAVRASSCLPQLSQAIQINNEFYWDGGYLGNPAIYPLIYNSQVDDIIIIHNNPILRDTIPITSTDISSRENEISFNSSLIRELRAIAFITKLIDKGWIKDEYKDKLRRKCIHIIRSDEAMNQFKLINKFNWQWYFISHLRDLGRKTADNWIKDNFDSLGKKPTIDFTEFLSTDTQTS